MSSVQVYKIGRKQLSSQIKFHTFTAKLVFQMARQNSDDFVNEDADYEQLNKAQRLKAAMYHGIKQIAREVEDEMEVSINSQVLACLSECLNRQVETYAVDLELFAKHAKRTNISVDDVKLLVRKNPTLLNHIGNLASEYATEKEATKKPKKTSDKKKTGT